MPVLCNYNENGDWCAHFQHEHRLVGRIKYTWDMFYGDDDYALLYTFHRNACIHFFSVNWDIGCQTGINCVLRVYKADVLWGVKHTES